MKRLLVLFTNSFPYSTGEPFLETEYPLYAEYFDKVLLVASCKRNEPITRRIDFNNTEVIVDYTLSKDLLSILQAIPYVLTDGLFYRELKHLATCEGFSLKKLYDLIVFSLCGNHRALKAKRWLRKHSEYQLLTIYAYWLHIPAYAALRLKNMLKSKPYTISRAHGYDLYRERHDTGYIPFHKQFLEGLDQIASISNQGKEYLQNSYGKIGNISIHRLGAANLMRLNTVSSREVLRVVSCARTVSLKRLDRIVDALAQFTDVPVEWTHIGDGPEQKNLEQYAKEHLSDNVKTIFMGNIPNEQVYEIYATKPFHVFANVSETEGIPVAIMEAMSFGIPVIATDVGGTAELVEHEVSGYLLKKDFTDEELAACIRKFIELSEGIYQGMRNSAHVKFEQEYCAETNYRQFLNQLRNKSF